MAKLLNCGIAIRSSISALFLHATRRLRSSTLVFELVRDVHLRKIGGWPLLAGGILVLSRWIQSWLKKGPYQRLVLLFSSLV
jgi:hypothetical protein